MDGMTNKTDAELRYEEQLNPSAEARRAARAERLRRERRDAALDRDCNYPDSCDCASQDCNGCKE
jgi:hypothetical protein